MVRKSIHGPKPLTLQEAYTMFTIVYTITPVMKDTDSFGKYYSGNKRAEFPSFRRIPLRAREPESTEKTGCRIKSGMTNFKAFTCRCNTHVSYR